MQFDYIIYNGYLISQKDSLWIIDDEVNFYEEYSTYKQCIDRINELKEE